MKPFFLIPVVTLFLCGQPGSAQTDQEIAFLIFNGEHAAADVMIETRISQQPGDPKNYFLKAHNAFYSRYFSPQPLSRDSVLQIIFDYATTAVKIGEALEASVRNNFVIGSAYGLLSRVHIMRQEFWSGYWRGRESRNYLTTVIEEDPEFADAYLGLGVIEYYPSRLTGLQAGMAWLGGMGGDREKGLEYFSRTARSGILLKPEATFALAYLFRFVEPDYVTANRYFSELHQQFPGNSYFAAQHEQTRLALLIETNGVAFLREGLDTLRSSYQITNSGVLNGMAYGFLGRGQTETALALFELNIELYADEANPYDSIAECFETLGDREMTIRYARLCLEKLAADSTISDDFRETLKELNEERLSQLGSGA